MGASGSVDGRSFRLVLASASPRRRELLSELGMEFEVLPADIDERLRPGEVPAAHAGRLAVDKAEAVLARLPHAGGGAGAGTRVDGVEAPTVRVLGADTIVVAPGGEILGKPVDGADARRMLMLLSDATHEVLTGIAVAEPGRPTRHRVERTRVTFVELDVDRIDAYVAGGEPFDAAGAYAIQGGAGGFVSRIDGSFDNVVGLPVHRVADLLDLG